MAKSCSVGQVDDSPAARKCGSGYCCCVVFVLILGVPVIWLTFGFDRTAVVRLTIDSFEGLPQNESNTVFSPKFNIKISGKKPKHGLSWLSDTFCYSSGSIHIWYQGFSIASGSIVGSCLDATNGHTVMLFAWGRDIELPLYFENRLRAEAEHGTAVLDTEIQFDDGCHSISCWPCIGNKGYSQCKVH